MDFESSRPGILLVTAMESAFIWLLPSVDEHMGVQVALCDELFVTVRLLALKRPLPCMSPDMCLQISSLSEVLLAVQEWAE